jgi:hypothetical protein
VRRTDRRRQEQIASVCGDLEESLEQLRTRYELYFVGVERREPNRERDEMKRAIGRIKGDSASVNTGLRFRIDTLHARLLSYERMWMRSGREKEEGTYRRDIQRLRRRSKPDEVSKPVEGPKAGVSKAANEDLVTPRPKPAPQTAASAARPSTPPEGAGGFAPEQLRELFVAYVDAKKRCNEDVSRLTYEGLEKTVSRQVPELLARYKAKSVEFKVLIKDGKALLKAIPRT